MIKLTFKGLKVFQNKLNRAQERIDKKIYENVQKEADYIENKSRSNAPVDTGELRRSQYREERLKDRKLIIKIGFKAYYAPFHEFGTGNPKDGGHFRLNAEYSEFAKFAFKFKGNGKPKPPVRPRRYFLHHYIVSRRKLNRTTSTLMKNILK